jgi:hypothetical protein
MEKIEIIKRLKKQKTFIDFYGMERLDQGHLHPKKEVPRLTGPGRESYHGERRAL